MRASEGSRYRKGKTDKQRVAQSHSFVLSEGRIR